MNWSVLPSILDFIQPVEKLAKPAARDLAKGNLTAPIISALENKPKLRARDIIDLKFSNSGSLKDAIELVFRGGGIEITFDLARES